MSFERNRPPEKNSVYPEGCALGAFGLLTLAVLTPATIVAVKTGELGIISQSYLQVAESPIGKAILIGTGAIMGVAVLASAALMGYAKVRVMLSERKETKATPAQQARLQASLAAANDALEKGYRTLTAKSEE